ncbi:MAG: hypothetical protein FJW96_11700 [Actinobacteria bacterium]|nr:hypothetical protein [Actinomycetota bacterium]
MAELWTPGMAGPLGELVKRIHRRIDRFREEHKVDEVAVTIELFDGSSYRLASLDAEPGFGFVTLCPHCDEGDPAELIVPLGAIRQIRIAQLEPEQPLGFSISVDAS